MADLHRQTGEAGCANLPPIAPTAGSLAVLIPALNCASTISDVVAQARRFVQAVFVIDDGSADATGQLAAESGATVLVHRETLGKGAALLTGLQELSRAGFR